MYRKVMTTLGAGFFCLSTLVAADDTEIYLDPNSPNMAPPLLMLSFDYRPNLGASACSDYELASCEALAGPLVYPYLLKNINEFGVRPKLDDTGNQETDPNTGLPLYEQTYRDPDADGVIDVKTVEPFDLVRAVLRAVLSDPAMSGLNLGLMLSHADTCTGAGASGPNQIGYNCSNGAYILKGFTPLTEDDFNTTTWDVLKTSERYQLIEKLGAIPTPQGNLSHSYQLREIYLELYNYLTGGQVYNGYLGFQDYASSTRTNNLDDPANNFNSGGVSASTTAFAWDQSIINGTTTTGGSGNYKYDGSHQYITPFDDSRDWSCSKLFLVNTYFEDNFQDDSDYTINTTVKGTDDAGTERLIPPLSGGDGEKNKQLISFLNRMDIIPAVDGKQNLSSFFITAKTTTNNADAYAFSGGTGSAMRLNEPGKLVEDLYRIFKHVLSTSTTFVSASVPVNVFNRTDVVDNVYFAIFQAEGKPRWSGNVKKLKIRQNTDLAGNTTLDLVSAEDQSKSAIDYDGRIRHDALTYWTDAAGYDVQATFSEDEWSGRDGRSINRGGAGQRIPGYLGLKVTEAGSPGLTNSEGQRRLYTESVSDTSVVPYTVMDLNFDTITPALLMGNLGAADATEAGELVQWIRGWDVDDENLNKNTLEARPWLMGDPMHARPIAVNYGCRLSNSSDPDPACESPYSKDNPNLRLFFGSNDGLIRAVKDSASGTPATGEELFAFAPRDTMAIHKSLRQNAISVRHPYGVDGAPVVLRLDRDGDGNIEPSAGDRVILYSGLRRGGRSLYALNVSDPRDTVKPLLQWKINRIAGENGWVSSQSPYFNTGLNHMIPGEMKGGKLYITSGTQHVGESPYEIINNDESRIEVQYDPDGSGNLVVPEFVNAESNLRFHVERPGTNFDTSFEELGLTFSTPRVAWVKFAANPQPVLIFAGGYSPNKDNGNNSDDNEGNAIYIVDALSGKLIWKAVRGSGSNRKTVGFHSELVDSIPSPVTVIDTDGDGLHDRLYVGDSGGSVWRVDFPAVDESAGTSSRATNWFITKLADLGDDADPNDRRFFHEPDVVRTKDAQGNRYDAVILTSGNRAAPKESATEDYLYVLRDRVTISGNRTALADQGVITHDLPVDVTNPNGDGSSDCSQGCPDSGNWKHGWKLPLPYVGEKGLAPVLTNSGTIFFTSYLPNVDWSAGDISADIDPCAPSEGSGRIWALRLGDASVDHNALGITLDDVQGYSDGYVDSGAGIPSGPTALGDGHILLPGKGVNGQQIVKGGGSTRWRTYWRDQGIDIQQ